MGETRRLIHYSKTPLLKVESRKHREHGGGAYKTPGLWISVEGEDDWLAWCRGEGWRLDGFTHATEIVLIPDAKVKRISGERELKDFTAEFSTAEQNKWLRKLDWIAIRKRWHGLIIAPYCWECRLAENTFWYYSWDCASGVIWNAKAIKELRQLPAPDLSEKAA